MKAVCWKLLKLLSQKQSVDRQTNLIPIGHPSSGRVLIKVVIKVINLGVIWRNFTNLVIVLNMKSLSLAIRKFCPRCDLEKGSPKRRPNGTKINNTSSNRSLLCIQFVTEVLWSEDECQRRGPSATYFCTTLDPSLGGSGRKTPTLVKDHENFILTNFQWNPSGGSKEEVENVTDGQPTTDYFGSGALNNYVYVDLFR